MKTLLFFSLMSMTQNSFAGLFFKPKDVCNVITGVSVESGIACDRIIEGKTYHNDYAKKCLEIAELIKKMKTPNIADTNFCMQQIANVPANSLTKIHIKTCEKLIDLNQTRSAAICMGNPSAFVEVCRPTLDNGNIPKAKDCLDAINVARESQVAVTDVQQCQNPPGIPLKTITPDNIIDCLKGQVRAKNPNADFSSALTSNAK